MTNSPEKGSQEGSKFENMTDAELLKRISNEYIISHSPTTIESDPNKTTEAVAFEEETAAAQAEIERRGLGK